MMILHNPHPKSSERKIEVKRRNKKKRRIKKTSSSSDDHQVDHSNTGPGEVSSSKRQKTMSGSHKPVSFLRFSQRT
jgi:hypothetical protein